MKAKILVYALPALILATIHLAQAQQTKKIPRIGYIAARSAPEAGEKAFLQGLQSLGYIEGQTITIEWRYAQQKFDRLPELASELVRLKVDHVSLSTSKLSNCGCLSQARNHRHLDQILASERLIVRCARHRLPPILLLFRITGFEVVLVGDRDLVHILESDRATLPLVAVQLGFGNLFAQHAHQFFGQIEPVMDAAIHAHATERIVEVCGVACQKYAALAIGFGNALMHRIESAMRNLVAAWFLPNSLQPPLHAVVRKDVPVPLFGMRREHYAPHARYAEQEKPFLGIGKIADVAKVRNHVRKLERRARYQKAFRPGETLQVNACLLYTSDAADE